MSDIVVYTAISDGYDTLKAQPESAHDADFIAFVDDMAQAPQGWQLQPMNREIRDPCRRAKRYKLFPHLFFPGHEYSLWIDGSVTITYPFPTGELIERYLGEHDLCLFRHSRRGCLYEEAATCKELRLDDAGVIDAQVERYRQDGYPEGNGLVEATVLLRRHSKAMQEFSAAWWKEIAQGSKRDQISFNYAARKAGLRWNEFEGSVIRENGLFKKEKHLIPRPALTGT